MSLDNELIGAKSDKGPVRRANEDAFWVSDATTPVGLGALYIVSDGVGGQVHGAAAAHLAVQVVSQAFYEERRQGTAIPEALDKSIHQANMAIYDQAHARGTGKMGCTLVAAVLHEAQLHIAHVGDARAYLLQGNQLRRLTRDDTWVQKQVEAGIITAEDAEKHELRNVVTQALGNKPQLDVHLAQPLELNSNDKFLLCSDGLHGVLSNEYLYRVLKNNPSREAANILVQSAIDANTQDNVTAVVVDSGRIEGTPTLVETHHVETQKERRMPVSLLVVVAVALIAIAGLSLFRLLSTDNVTIDLGGGRTTNGNGQAEEPRSLPALDMTTVSPVSATAPANDESQDLQSLAPDQSPGDASSPASTPETIVPLLGCISGDGPAFVWRDDQVRSTACNHFSESVLQTGQQIRIVDDDAISVIGPDRSCREAAFIKVQAVDNPNVEGWVLQSSVRTIGSGETCSP